MVTEYKLSYPAAEINEKLGKIVDLDTTLTHEGEAADAKATGDAVGRKVDKVDGKGLSSNDYDNAAKAKVDAIPENPQYTDTVYDDTEVKQGLNQIKSGALLKSGGDMTGAINMNGQPISGLNAPTKDTQAANKRYVDAAKTEAKAYTDSKRKTWTATITTTWSGSGPYTQSVTVSGILTSDMPHITPVYSSGNDTALAQKEAWACVSNAVTGANSITFACFEDKPAIEIPIQIEVMR